MPQCHISKNIAGFETFRAIYRWQKKWLHARQVKRFRIIRSASWLFWWGFRALWNPLKDIPKYPWDMKLCVYFGGCRVPRKYANVEFWIKKNLVYWFTGCIKGGNWVAVILKYCLITYTALCGVCKLNSFLMYAFAWVQCSALNIHRNFLNTISIFYNFALSEHFATTLPVGLYNYLLDWLTFYSKLGKYTSPMDPIG